MLKSSWIGVFCLFVLVERRVGNEWYERGEEKEGVVWVWQEGVGAAMPVS